jgi:hypothetical protein
MTTEGYWTKHSREALILALDTALGGPWARHYAARVPPPESRAQEG